MERFRWWATQLNMLIAFQIVPVVNFADFTSVSSDGSSAAAVIRGVGFTEGVGTYTFATTSVVDTNTQTGPDVYYDTSAGYRLNGQVGLTVPLNGNVYGAVTVTTAGGTSAPYTVGLSKDYVDSPPAARPPTPARPPPTRGRWCRSSAAG